MRIGPREFEWGVRTYVMGVLNVSPDSFSGDGLTTIDAAVAQATRFAREGADLLDIGGQSTRPGQSRTEAGFDEITADEERARVIPVIKAVQEALPDMPISVDTYKPAVARSALIAGAHMLNDISGFRHDPALAATAAAFRVPACIMHNQRGRAGSGDVIDDVTAGLRSSMRIAAEAGIAPDMLIADPGFGFGWSPERNIEMLRRLSELTSLGLPLLVGTSRKSTIGAVLGGVPVADRLFGTAASVALCIANGADIVRVHDVPEMKHVALTADAIVRGWSDG